MRIWDVVEVDLDRVILERHHAKSSRAEAAVGKRKRPRGGGLSLALDGSFEVRAQGRSWGGEAQGEHFVSTDPRDTLPALCFNRVSWSAEMVSS
jgi:hypothetical protein